MKTLTKLAIVGSILAFTNGNSFTSVAFQKNVMHYSQKKAAFLDRLGSDILNRPGYILGHKIFYGNSNEYKETFKQNAIEYFNKNKNEIKL
jgi:hypothetical protein